jgi:hypothetical protein
MNSLGGRKFMKEAKESMNILTPIGPLQEELETVSQIMSL